MARVVCAGHVNWDVTLRVDRLPEPDGEASIRAQHQSGGGSASNAAVTLAGLGVDTHLLGSVGADEHGQRARRELRDSGVETHLVEGAAQTAVKYLVVGDEGEVFVLGNEGGNEAFVADDLPASALADADVLHLTNQAPATASALATRAVDAGVTVSFDPGRRLTDRDYDATLAQTDVLFVNRRERERGKRFDAVPLVVEKRGPDGAVVHAEDRRIDHPGFVVDSVDTTGAGDAFAAGFLVARLRDEDLEASLAIGNACGALATRSIGAHLDVEWSDVEAVLDAGPAQ